MWVLVDADEGFTVDNAATEVFGRGPHQAPDVDGNVRIVDGPGLAAADLRPGDLVRCRIDDSDGIDLVATALHLAVAEETAAVSTVTKATIEPGLEVATR